MFPHTDKRMENKKRKILWGAGLILMAAAMAALCFFTSRKIFYPMPYRSVTEESGLERSLVYAVMKAESGFDERAESGAGALGLMQLMPSTAEFICRLYGIGYEREKLLDGAYNLKLGCLYLKYLFGRFREERTALAAYNAGEGTVFEWLRQKEYSVDGVALTTIPYPETREYVKKVEKFRKIYRIFYH